MQSCLARRRVEQASHWRVIPRRHCTADPSGRAEDPTSGPLCLVRVVFATNPPVLPPKGDPAPHLQDPPFDPWNILESRRNAPTSSGKNRVGAEERRARKDRPGETQCPVWQGERDERIGRGGQGRHNVGPLRLRQSISRHMSPCLLESRETQISYAYELALKRNPTPCHLVSLLIWVAKGANGGGGMFASTSALRVFIPGL